MLQLIKTRIIKALGGFPKLEDAIDAIQEKNLEERKTLLTLAVRRLFNTIGPDDILKEDPNGQWIFEGKVMTDGLRKLLIAEATQLEQMTLWKVLQKDVQYQSNRRMFLIGKTEMDIIIGKVWLYSFDAIRTRLSSLAKGRGKFNVTG